MNSPYGTSGPVPLTNRPGSPCAEPISMLGPPKSTQFPFHWPYTSGGCSGGMVRSTRHASAPPKFFESVMQSDFPDGVVKATSSPNCVVVPSRVAEWNWPASAGWPDSTKATTSAMSEPASGGLAGVIDVGVVVCGVDIVVLVGADGDVCFCSASPPIPCEQPPPSTEAAISTAIRISARLAGRRPDTGEARAVSSFATVG